MGDTCVMSTWIDHLLKETNCSPQAPKCRALAGQRWVPSAGDNPESKATSTETPGPGKGSVLRENHA